MKHLTNKLFLFILTASFSLGCADLDEKPVGLLAPESLFRTAKDVETAVFGAYGWIATERLYGRQFVSALMLRSDMVDIGDRGTPAERQQVNDFNMDDNNNMVNQFWPNWYQTISAANAAISGGAQLGLPEAEINPLIAEARFVRAFAYFNLVQVFGDVPYIDYFISNPEAVKEISRTPAATVYASIIADLEFAKQWLPEKQPSEVRSRASKGTAASYLASVHLTLADYAKAYAEAKYVIDNKDKFGYALEADFQTLFVAPQAPNMKEHIFDIDFLGLKNGEGGANDDIMAPMTGVRGGDAPRSGWSVLVPSMNVFNTWDNRDYRKEVSFDDSLLIGGKLVPYTEFPNTKRPHIAKYARFAGTSNSEGRYSDHNYAAMRYAEILLIAAEASVEVNGPNAEALTYINEIRARARNWAGKQTAFPANVAAGLSKAALIDLIMEERRIELAFEYKRWFDIKRRNMGETVFSGPKSLEPHTSFNPARDYLMPIPRVELQVNPNLGPQNPGY
ncbi:RagB/SusD family nutrient uptake outer membrane protein [Dyadobacter chenhuakuii]|uniref:RagB/SusD family nutrient uptake outer membrane protein n=1 Tax=Dyadobacter chenhuakuii TaxID=2909339 RepID=A0A9X1QHF6_9BACT|nr:RagB/SusD family nutrient uptake outer membrane protein [Dyadobacter chenhuakuii]MCF2499774.1 RagB/SusD family nutrient uptake outer membrane protein [Dyadobacter chenhuakuii]